jgi:predicted lipoprotein
MSRTGFLVLAFLAATVSAAQAAYDAATYRALNDALVEDHIVPRYAKLAEATGRLNTLAEHICEMPSSMSVNDLRKAAVAAQDAWQRVQHVRFGPVEQDMRATRIAFWPDVRDRTGRALGEIR